jgi:hypothetical protein
MRRFLVASLEFLKTCPVKSLRRFECSDDLLLSGMFVCLLLNRKICNAFQPAKDGAFLRLGLPPKVKTGYHDDPVAVGNETGIHRKAFIG